MSLFEFFKSLFGNKKKKRLSRDTGRAHTPPAPPKGETAVSETPAKEEKDSAVAEQTPTEQEPPKEEPITAEEDTPPSEAGENAPQPKAGNPPPVAEEPAPEEQEKEGAPKAMPVADKIFEEGKKHLGTPYVYGGATPEGFDCSGFIAHAFEIGAGIELPRVSRQQAKVGKTIDAAAAEKGDLVFFSHTGKSINHVGIIASETGEPLRMIHASSSQGVIISDLENSSYWKPRITHFQRVLGELA